MCGVHSLVVEAAALVGAADALFAATGGLGGLRSGWCGLQRWSAYARCEYKCTVLLTCVPGPDSNWRKPPEGNRGRDDGISVPWKFVNDDVLPGKMLVECYLAEDSCMRDEEREEKEEEALVSWVALTKAAREGGGRSHRLLTVLYHGTHDQVAAGAMENEVVSAHCCCAVLGRSEWRAAEVSCGEAQGRRSRHARDRASR